jgi:hypothetical protein
MHQTAHEGDEAVASGSDSVAEETFEMVLWTRRPVCGPRTAVIDQLSKLRTDGVIADFEIRTWPDEIALSEHTEHSRVVEQYKEFLLWADDHDVSITPPFERRRVSSLVGKSEEVLTVPIMCLAVYEDDDLRGVYPNTDDGETTSVTDYLDAYSTDRSAGDTTQ